MANTNGNSPDKEALASFKKMILDMVPAAKRVAMTSLKLRRNTIGRDGVEHKPIPIQPKSIDMSRWVLEQYAQLVKPGEADVHELHIVDHAMLAKMTEARDVVKEINSFHKSKKHLSDRGLDFESN